MLYGTILIYCPSNVPHSKFRQTHWNFFGLWLFIKHQDGFLTSPWGKKLFRINSCCKISHPSNTGCCWYIFTAFMKLLRIIKWKNFAFLSFRFWFFLQLLLQTFFDSGVLSQSRSKIQFFGQNSRSGLLIWFTLVVQTNLPTFWLAYEDKKTPPKSTYAMFSSCD